MHINLDDEISFSYEMDLDRYKKKIIREILNDLKKIYNFFDDKGNDMMIKLFILYKKEDNKIKKYLEPYLDLVIKLSKLEYIDQEEYFSIIFKTIQIYKIKDKLEEHITNKINSKLEESNNKIIEIKIFNEKVTNFIEELKETNKIINKILKINDKIQDNERNIKNINQISVLLCKELYMKYDSEEAYSIISKVIKNMYKDIFKKKYDDTKKKIKFIYDDEINKTLVIKYKINFEKKNILKLLENFNKLNSILDK